MNNRLVTKDDVESFLNQLRSIDVKSSGARAGVISDALSRFFLPGTGIKACRTLRDNFKNAVSSVKLEADDNTKLKQFFELSQEIFEGFNITNNDLRTFRSTFGIETKVTPTNSPRPN